MAINILTASVKAKIYLFSRAYPSDTLCFYNYERHRTQTDHYIMRDMTNRIVKKFKDNLEMIIFYSNEKNPEIRVSVEVARWNYYDRKLNIKTVR